MRRAIAPLIGAVVAAVALPTPPGVWLIRRAWAGFRAAQCVVGPGAQQRLMNVAMQYACPVQ